MTKPGEMLSDAGRRPYQHPASQRFGVLLWLASFGSLALLISFIWYIRGNEGNHTGFDPWELSYIFVPTALIGIVALLRRRFARVALLACCAGVGGMGFLFYIDRYNVMVEHDEWCHRGQPEAWTVTPGR